MATALAELAESIYRRHMRAIYRFCLWRTNSAHDAEDLTTEVFVKLLSGKADKVAPERLMGWLLKVADNECKMLWRRRGRRPETALDQGVGVGAPDSRPWISPEICLAVSGLKPRQKTVLFLKAVERFPFKEIARALGITEGAAKMAFYRATQNLAHVLKEEQDD